MPNAEFEKWLAEIEFTTVQIRMHLLYWKRSEFVEPINLKVDRRPWGGRINVESGWEKAREAEFNKKGFSSMFHHVSGVSFGSMQHRVFVSARSRQVSASLNTM